MINAQVNQPISDSASCIEGATVIRIRANLSCSVALNAHLILRLQGSSKPWPFMLEQLISSAVEMASNEQVHLKQPTLRNPEACV